MVARQSRVEVKKASSLTLVPDLKEIYFRIKSEVTTRGYNDEIAWQESLSFEDVTESDFLRELAWVVLCSGFKEATIRKKFSYLSLCFCDWQSASEIIASKELCRSTAVKAFSHEGKIEAILQAAESVETRGFSNLKKEIEINPILTLKMFPYIGGITVWHLAKNLGIPVAKPDRHLVRISRYMGYQDVQRFCGDISEISGDDIQVVDIVLWRYATFDTHLNVLRKVNSSRFSTQ